MTLAAGAGGGYADLSPISFLLRSAGVFAERQAVRERGRDASYAELHASAERLAGALGELGAGEGDRVATLLPNARPMLEAHFAVPGSGRVLVPLNFRLAGPELGYILDHSGARCLIADTELADQVEQALDALDPRPEVLWCAAPGGAGTPVDARAGSGAADPQAGAAAAQGSPPPGGHDYQQALAAADPVPLRPGEEGSLLSINYTSGTTGRPKGVMYTHRGAAVQAMGVIAEAGLSPASRYLWTLPMFHCHGWAYTWAVTAVGGRHVSLPKVEPGVAWELIEGEGVTHMCGAPTVLRMLIDAAPERTSRQRTRVFTGGAPPDPPLLRRCEELNWEVVHLYGLTETYGPLAVCEWHPEWDELDPDEQARLKARQGVASVVTQPLRVVDEEMRDVPADAETLGEVVMRGNNVTLGYYRDPDATREAFTDGWFHSGDVGVMHPDGYIELRDRIKDIIVSGGENISSIEVEHALMAHPDVSEAAVVGVPDEHWGERPKGFVTLSQGASATSDELVEFARGLLAGFKVPRTIEILDSMPTTPTGKVQKFLLRERA